MKILGLEISRASRAPEQSKGLAPITPIHDQRGWFTIAESFAGAWQKGVTVNPVQVTSYYALFACMTLIASDIAKLGIIFQKKTKGVWLEDDKPSPKSAVLMAPNPFQNRIQFFENWVLSKLMNGNTYVLKNRDARGVVNRLYVLDPNRVQVLVSETGDVFYKLMSDNVSGLVNAEFTAPASEIIHDRMNCLFHPLVGLSPIYAAGLAAMQGIAIQTNATKFFNNRSIPGGILTSPHTIPDATAKRLKEDWDRSTGGDNQGKTAVLGDGLEFKSMAVSATDAQMLEQAKATAEWVCSAFHVPPYKIGLGITSPGTNVQALNLEYYSQCLQILIEAAEECLDRGLELTPNIGIAFDQANLLRMDTVSQIASIKDAIGAGVKSPNEGRAELGLPPVAGGESPMTQQQNFSLAALAKRDAKEDPFATTRLSDSNAPDPNAPNAPNTPPDPNADPNAPPDPNAKSAQIGLLERGLRYANP